MKESVKSSDVSRKYDLKTRSQIKFHFTLRNQSTKQVTIKELGSKAGILFYKDGDTFRICLGWLAVYKTDLFMCMEFHYSERKPRKRLKMRLCYLNIKNLLIIISVIGRPGATTTVVPLDS